MDPAKLTSLTLIRVCWAMFPHRLLSPPPRLESNPSPNSAHAWSRLHTISSSSRHLWPHRKLLLEQKRKLDWSRSINGSWERSSALFLIHETTAITITVWPWKARSLLSPSLPEGFVLDIWEARLSLIWGAGFCWYQEDPGVGSVKQFFLWCDWSWFWRS